MVACNEHGVFALDIAHVYVYTVMVHVTMTYNRDCSDFAIRMTPFFILEHARISTSGCLCTATDWTQHAQQLPVGKNILSTAWLVSGHVSFHCAKGSAVHVIRRT